MRRGGKDAAIEVLLYRKGICYLVQQHAPLVEAEVVDDHEEDLLAFVKQREDSALEDVGTHHWPLVGILHPSHVVFADELRELRISLVTLHCKHLLHPALRLAQLKLPKGQFLIDFLPLLNARCVVDLHSEARELLLVA